MVQGEAGALRDGAQAVSGNTARTVGHPAALGLMCVLAVVHTLPLVMDPGGVIPGRDLGDNAAFVWNLWWFREAARLDVPFFHTTVLMAPHGADLALHTHTASQAWLAATVLGALSAVAAQNVLLIAALALNGFAVYLLALEAGAGRAGAVAGGVLFVVAPQVTVRLMGHFNLVVVWPLVLACWAFVRTLRAPTAIRGAILGLAVAFIAYTDYYYSVFFGLFAAAYLCTELWSMSLTPVKRAGGTWVACAAVGGVAVAAAAAIVISGGGAFAIAGMTVRATSPTNMLTTAWLAAVAAVVAAWRPGIQIRRRGGSLTPVAIALGTASVVALIALAPLLAALVETVRTGSYVTQAAGLRSGPQGIDIATLVLGPPFHGLVGSAIRTIYERLGIDVMEASGWIGATVMVLALMSLRRWREREHRRWLLVALVFVVWALGPYLIAAASNTGVLLPQAVARYVPFLNNARMPGRAMVVVSMLACVIAARYLSTHRRRVVAAAAALGVLESLASPLPAVAVPVSPAHAVLAGSSEPGGVLPVPFGLRDGFGTHGLVDHSALYFQTVHRRPIAGGFVARLPPRVLEWYDAREPYHALMEMGEGRGVPAGSPSCDEMKAGLDQASLAFVVVNRQLATPAMLELTARMPLTPIARDAQYDVFRIRSC